MAKTKIPQKPKELWMLWNIESEDWVLAVADPVPYLAYLCTDSKESAIALQQHQEDGYGVQSIPVRIIKCPKLSVKSR